MPRSHFHKSDKTDKTNFAGFAHLCKVGSCGQWRSLTFLTGGCNIGGFTDEVISREVTRLMELGGDKRAPKVRDI